MVDVSACSVRCGDYCVYLKKCSLITSDVFCLPVYSSEPISWQ